MISPVEAMIDYIINEQLEKTIVKSADSNWAKGLIKSLEIKNDPIIHVWEIPSVETYLRRINKYKRIRFSTTILPDVGFIDMSGK